MQWTDPRACTRLATLAAFATLATSASGQNAPRAAAAPRWTLVEDLRIGPSDAGPASFTDVRGFVATKAGTILVLDFRAQEIRVFDAQGQFLRLAARKGAGPGELGNANGMAVGPDDIVWVNDPSNSRFSLYRPSGEFLRQVVTPITRYGFTWGGIIDGMGRALDPNVAVTLARLDPATGRPMSEPRIRRIKADGSADTVLFPICADTAKVPPVTSLRFQSTDGRSSRLMSVPFLPRQQVAITSRGTVWCTTSAEYRAWTGPVGGSLAEVVNVAVPPVPVTAQERKRQVDYIDSLTQHYGPMTAGDVSAIPLTKPVVAALFADDEGRAWIRRTTTPDSTPSFEVYDATGRLVANVSSPGRVGSQVYIAGDHLLTLLTDADDVPFVARYRIVR